MHLKLQQCLLSRRIFRIPSKSILKALRVHSSLALNVSRRSHSQSRRWQIESQRCRKRGSCKPKKLWPTSRRDSVKDGRGHIDLIRLRNCVAMRPNDKSSKLLQHTSRESTRNARNTCHIPKLKNRRKVKESRQAWLSTSNFSKTWKLRNRTRRRTSRSWMKRNKKTSSMNVWRRPRKRDPRDAAKFWVRQNIRSSYRQWQRHSYLWMLSKSSLKVHTRKASPLQFEKLLLQIKPKCPRCTRLKVSKTLHNVSTCPTSSKRTSMPKLTPSKRSSKQEKTTSPTGKFIKMSKVSKEDFSKWRLNNLLRRPWLNSCRQRHLSPRAREVDLKTDRSLWRTKVPRFQTPNWPNNQQILPSQTHQWSLWEVENASPLSQTMATTQPTTQERRTRPHQSTFTRFNSPQQLKT